ncbi:NUDIX domain-containing protein [Paenibacillus sp. SYP-B3998]|uniref:NUDIX domain-containing protein n=1 Tax=Paenibacillus sp. SYP-B3998 TaxID=2678564 RepID=A0A6G3ZRP8_9BACL|nr:NUDIX domain-containing protein [Paenibacillus sp. SYP-B3998]
MIIRNSAKAIIVHENKLLVTKLEDNDGVFYLLPGGGQNAGENLHETLKRECTEEIGLKVNIGELAFIRECFMDKGIHRVEFIFFCTVDTIEHDKIIGAKGASLDNNQLGVEWIPILDLIKRPLFPSTLRELIVQHENGLNGRTIYLGEIQ